jgi:hypothetical protein
MGVQSVLVRWQQPWRAHQPFTPVCVPQTLRAVRERCLKSPCGPPFAGAAIPLGFCMSP